MAANIFISFDHDDQQQVAGFKGSDGMSRLDAWRIDYREWRLRGMATLEEYRGSGFGRRLAEHCAARATYHRDFLIWCSARMVAAPFYLSLGFEAHGEKFHLPECSSKGLHPNAASSAVTRRIRHRHVSSPMSRNRR